jgi:hypothetical protein
MALDRDKLPVNFSRRDAERVKRVVLQAERAFQNAPPRGATKGGLRNLRHAKTTTTVSARSGNTIGSGSADLYYVSGSTLTAESPTINVTVKNSFGTALASGKWVIIEPISGEWFLVAADC